MLYKKIGLNGFQFFKYIILSTIIATAIIPFYILPTNYILTTIGAYLSIIPKILLFYQIYNFDSNRYVKLINSFLIIFLTLLLTFSLSYLILMDSISTYVILPVIIDIVIMSIILGLTFSLKMKITPIILYFLGTLALLVNVINASYFYFTPDANPELNLADYLKITGYYLLVLAMYYQNKLEIKLTE